jgi:hypothetical protein
MEYHDTKLSYQEVAQRVFNDTKDKKKATQKEIAEQFSTEWHHRRYDLEHKLQRGTEAHELLYSNGIDNFEVTAELIEVAKKFVELEKEIRAEEKALREKHNIKFGVARKDRPKEYEKEQDALSQRNFEKRNKLWNEESKVIDNIASEQAKEWMKNHKQWWYTILSYADDDGSHGAVMEHGGIFRHVEHVQISHH